MASSGRNSEIERRRLVSIVRLHHCWKHIVCASDHEFGANRRSVTSSRCREDDYEAYCQHNRRTSSRAPTSRHTTLARMEGVRLRSWSMLPDKASCEEMRSPASLRCGSCLGASLWRPGGG